VNSQPLQLSEDERAWTVLINMAIDAKGGKRDKLVTGFARVAVSNPNALKFLFEQIEEKATPELLTLLPEVQTEVKRIKVENFTKTLVQTLEALNSQFLIIMIEALSDPEQSEIAWDAFEVLASQSTSGKQHLLMEGLFHYAEVEPESTENLVRTLLAQDHPTLNEFWVVLNGNVHALDGSTRIKKALILDRCHFSDFLFQRITDSISREKGVQELVSLFTPVNTIFQKYLFITWMDLIPKKINFLIEILEIAYEVEPSIYELIYKAPNVPKEIQSIALLRILDHKLHIGLPHFINYIKPLGKNELQLFHEVYQYLDFNQFSDSRKEWVRALSMGLFDEKDVSLFEKTIDLHKNNEFMFYFDVLKSSINYAIESQEDFDKSRKLLSLLRTIKEEHLMTVLNALPKMNKEDRQVILGAIKVVMDSRKYQLDIINLLAGYLTKKNNSKGLKTFFHSLSPQDDRNLSNITYKVQIRVDKILNRHVRIEDKKADRIYTKKKGGSLKLFLILLGIALVLLILSLLFRGVSSVVNSLRSTTLWGKQEPIATQPLKEEQALQHENALPTSLEGTQSLGETQGVSSTETIPQICTGIMNVVANLRKGPSKTANIVGGLKKGDKVGIYAKSESGDWFAVNEEKTKWIFGSLVELDCDVTLIPTFLSDDQ